MGAEWRVFFDQKTSEVLAAEYLVPADLRAPGRGEGARIRILTRRDVDGISLPAQILTDGIDANGVENGHVKVTKIEHTSVGPFDPTVFMHPEELKKHDEGDVFD